jgi:rSAM/selenodomain-associated transferase 1
VFRTVPPPAQRILVFARLPQRGAVKTRLAAGVGEDRALAIYEAMLRELLANLGNSTPDTEIEFLWAPASNADGSLLRRAFGHHATAIQTGDDLGDRLAMALSERFFFHRTQKILAIGVDDPTLTRAALDCAFALLDSCEYVIGPAADGGYYLIGCRALAFDSSVFQGIDWGTPSVFSTTMQRIAALERTVAVLPERFDVDTAEDLERFVAANPESELSRV